MSSPSAELSERGVESVAVSPVGETTWLCSVGVESGALATSVSELLAASVVASVVDSIPDCTSEDTSDALIVAGVPKTAEDTTIRGVKLRKDRTINVSISQPYRCLEVPVEGVEVLKPR